MYASLKQEREMILTRLRSRMNTLYWVSSVTLCLTAFITFWLTLGPGPGMLALTIAAILGFFGFWFKWVLLEILPDIFRLREITNGEQVKYETPSHVILESEIVSFENPLDRAYYGAQFQ